MTISVDHSLKYWLLLLRVPGIGSKTFVKTLDNYQPDQLFKQSHSTLSALGLRDKSITFIKNPDWVLIEQDLAWLEQQGNSVITINDVLYPAQLKEIDSPPPLLFIRGNSKILSQAQISIVGSRNPSTIGLQTATAFAKSLSQAGFVITSGLALGIDAASHQGALNAKGYTIAVAGTGLDRVYPARNKELASHIANSGALISEFPPGTSAHANHFPRRNRIISGLCVGLLVVEAAKKSGSLITARMALDANREVFAIPGSIHNPLARGCNALIREGAKLVESTQDIFDELGQYSQQPEEINQEKLETTLDLEQQNLLNLIMFSPTSIDYLVQESGYTVEVISSMLLMFELQGSIATVPGGYIRIK
ncbi:MAG: DNA-protecting protein DprA [Methylococcales symbiont of Hymedesmia sp. n. MRB-2018]|nr:MAG: DNA-protecting protein DprA [Methylococcales symbiont of Hymedesmia sp. n. MRB-2018]KAF3983467.1 MAG: DNA-protecting protein DprA [Methylococcales symbiont of Hymedesmia sp. n. MRB-2018]